MGKSLVHLFQDALGLFLRIVKIDESVDSTHTAFYAATAQFVSD